MAGNYRSHGNGITRSVDRAVRGARSAHTRKNTLNKQTQAAKDVISHKAKVTGKQARRTIITKAKSSIAVSKAKGAQQRRTATHKAKVSGKAKVSNKPKNDMQVGKKKNTKTKTATKKRRVAKDKKW